jgi:hypothetical protein
MPTANAVSSAPQKTNLAETGMSDRYMHPAGRPKAGFQSAVIPRVCRNIRLWNRNIERELIRRDGADGDIR